MFMEGWEHFMTLGDKIKKYRMMKDLTQKELGQKVGFSSATADSRIRKYEKDLMAPKSDIRAAIANALDIDIEAISDINISSFADIMYLFFELEEKLGMDIEKKDGRTYLSFDDHNQDIQTLITYMNLWKNQKQISGTGTEEQKMDYHIWKSRFLKNTREYFDSKKKEIDDKYAASSKAAAKNEPYANKSSEITLLLRKMTEAGLTITSAFTNTHNTDDGPGFTFIVNELLTPISKEAEALFTRFYAELNHFRSLGAEVTEEIQMIENALTITYHIPVSSFSVIHLQFQRFLEHWNNPEKENEFFRDSFEGIFEKEIRTNFINIEEEITRHAKIKNG